MRESPAFVSCATTLQGLFRPHHYTVSNLCVTRRIIEPLASRCSKFRFKPLDTSSTSSRLAQIALSERVQITDEVISALVLTSAGDLRRSITYLQSASRLSSSTTPPASITPRDIQEIAGVVPDEVMNNFVSSLGAESTLSTPSKHEVHNFDSIRQQVKSIMREGYSAAQVLSQVRFYPHAWVPY